MQATAAPLHNTPPVPGTETCATRNRAEQLRLRTTFHPFSAPKLALHATARNNFAPKSSGYEAKAHELG